MSCIKKTNISSIASIPNLASALGVQESDLHTVVNLPDTKKYKKIIIEKVNGTREVYNPCSRVRKIQKRINSRIFSNDVLVWDPYLYGSIKKDENDFSRDYIECARRHCGAKSILKMDIENFFDNINYYHVISIFEDLFKYPPDVSEMLAKICTAWGKVPQGGITSSALAMAALFKVEKSLVTILKRKGLIYTRYVDDIVVSSKVTSYDFSFAKKKIEAMLLDQEFPVNDDKTIIMRSSIEPLEVLGLRVSFKEPRLKSIEVRRIRAAVRDLEKSVKDSNYRQTHSYRKDFNRVQGRVNKLVRLGHMQGDKLNIRLQKIKPKPSIKDIGRCRIRYIWLCKYAYTYGRKSLKYKNKYNLLQNRLNFLQRSYSREATIIRDKMKLMRPL